MALCQAKRPETSEQARVQWQQTPTSISTKASCRLLDCLGSWMPMERVQRAKVPARWLKMIWPALQREDEAQLRGRHL